MAHSRLRRMASGEGLASSAALVGVGLALLGVLSYVFLMIAARSIAPDQFAAVTVVWTTLFTLGPGLFLPIEQAIARHLSTSDQDPSRIPTVRRLVWLGGVFCLALVVLGVALWPVIGEPVFDNDMTLFVWTLAATSCLWPVHTARGLLAGTGRFRNYGAQLAVDGIIRAAGAGLLALLGADRAWEYAAVFVVSQLIATAVTLGALRRRHGQSSERAAAVPAWSLLVRELGWMVIAVLCSQLLINGGTYAVKGISDPQDPVAGVFLTALVVSRLPLFLFSSLQASLMPNLAGLIARGDLTGMRAVITKVTTALAALGVLATAVFAAVGPPLLVLAFGPRFTIDRLTLGVLTLSCGVYMVAAALSQIALADHRNRQTALVWVAAVATLALGLVVPIELTLRVSVAMLAGATVAVLGFWLTTRQVAHRMRVTSATPGRSPASPDLEEPDAP